MPARIYRDLADTMNKSKFEVRVPDNYEPVLPGYYRKYPERNPIYYGITEDCYATMTISGIVDMCVNNVTFTIVNRADVPLISEILEAYIKAIAVSVDALESSHPHKVFLNNCRLTLNTLRDSTNRAEREEEAESKVRKPKDLLSVLQRMNELGGGL